MTAPKYRIDWTTIPKEDQKVFFDILKIECYRAVMDLGKHIWEDVRNEIRRAGDNEKGIEEGSRNDRGDPTGSPSTIAHCANPAGVWGHDHHGNAICETLCPEFGTCKVPHTSLNNLGASPQIRPARITGKDPEGGFTERTKTETPNGTADHPES